MFSSKAGQGIFIDLECHDIADFGKLCCHFVLSPTVGHLLLNVIFFNQTSG